MKIRECRELSDVLSNYDYTSKLGRDRWAWEFCCRDPEFRDIAHHYNAGDHVSRKAAHCRGVTLPKLRSAQPEAEARGLAFFPNPDFNGLKADVFWSAYRYPREISVHVVEVGPDVVDEFVILALQRCQITHLTGINGDEQFILRGAGCALQVNAGGVSLLSRKPHKMVVTVSADESFEAKFEILKRARRVYGDHDTSPPAWTKRGRELRDALICLDCKEAGLSYWEMAEVINGRDHVSAIKERGSRSLKETMRRNLQRGRALRDGGYRELLLPRTKGSLLAA